MATGRLIILLGSTLHFWLRVRIVFETHFSLVFVYFFPIFFFFLYVLIPSSAESFQF